MSLRLEQSLHSDFDSTACADGAMRLRDLAARKPGSPQSALLHARSLYWLAYTRYICGSDSLMRLYADSAASLLASPSLAGAPGFCG